MNIKCEVCNGSNIIKKENIFICQDCGIGYSLDEIRKLLQTNEQNFITQKPDTEIQPQKKTHEQPKDKIVEQSLKVGDKIQFGRYYQDEKSEEKEPLSWIILQSTEQQLLLLCEKGISAKKYNDEFVYTTWEHCTVRKWLNNNFINEAFTEQEIKKICTVECMNPDNVQDDPNHIQFRTSGGNNTMDKIFLLNEYQALFLTKASDRICHITTRAKAEGAFTYDNSDIGWWWLRTPGFEQKYTEVVRGNSEIHKAGNMVINEKGTIRPALFITK